MIFLLLAIFALSVVLFFTSGGLGEASGYAAMNVLLISQGGVAACTLHLSLLPEIAAGISGALVVFLLGTRSIGSLIARNWR